MALDLRVAIDGHIHRFGQVLAGDGGAEGFHLPLQITADDWQRLPLHADVCGGPIKIQSAAWSQDLADRHIGFEMARRIILHLCIALNRDNDVVGEVIAFHLDIHRLDHRWEVGERQGNRLDRDFQLHRCAAERKHAALIEQTAGLAGDVDTAWRFVCYGFSVQVDGDGLVWRGVDQFAVELIEREGLIVAFVSPVERHAAQIHRRWGNFRKFERLAGLGRLGLRLGFGNAGFLLFDHQVFKTDRAILVHLAADRPGDRHDHRCAAAGDEFEQARIDLHIDGCGLLAVGIDDLQSAHRLLAEPCQVDLVDGDRAVDGLVDRRTDVAVGDAE